MTLSSSHSTRRAILPRRAALAAVTALAALAGCGQDTFVAPPDCGGRRLVAYARRPIAGLADVYLFDFDGNGFHLMPNLNHRTLNDVNPTLSSDGRFIAFERELNGGDSDILLYDRCADQLLPQPGLNTPGLEGQPAFSHDGLRLAFVRDTLGRRRIRLYDGTAARLIPLPALEAAGAYADSAPSLDQNGTVIAFVSTRNGNADVLVYDLVGDSLRSLPDLASTANDVDPGVTPDGHYLVFASNRAGGAGDYDLYLYDLQARSFLTVAPEVNTQYVERSPTINVDANRIVFESNRTGSQGMDLWLYTRSTGHAEHTGASSASNDVEPCIQWQ